MMLVFTPRGGYIAGIPVCVILYNMLVFYISNTPTFVILAKGPFLPVDRILFSEILTNLYHSYMYMGNLLKSYTEYV